MTLMPEIRDALTRAVPIGSVRSRWPPSRRAGIVAVGVLAVSGSALAATGGWHPVLGDDDRGHPRPARATIPPPYVAALTVLRRAQTDEDRDPKVRSVLRLLAGSGISGVYTDAIRLLRQREDGITMLVPAERLGNGASSSASIQRDVLCVLTSATSTRTATVKDRNGNPRTIQVPRGVGQVCGDLRQLRTTGIGAAGTRRDNGFSTGALVPDGVASVVIRLRNDRHLTAKVRDNYYEINTGNELAPGWAVRWLDARGNTIRRRNTNRP